MEKLLALVSRNILRRRKELGMSQRQLAQAAQCHRSEISMIEAGRRNISVLKLMRIASALETSLENIFHDGVMNAIEDVMDDAQMEPAPARD
ncbi:MAG TPA: helix-turn-helix transcriptional regulator [Drouetiella sp.]|jgi:transcriptional regulator with XRE-family HTH domain